MSEESIDSKFERAFSQAGYAASGLSAGAREQLAKTVEELAGKYGLGEALEQLKAGIGARCDALAPVEPIPPSNNEAANFAHACLKESGAAAMSAVVGGVANSFEYLELVRAGKMDIKDAFLKVAGETVASAADSAFKAAGEKGRHILREKYGSEEAALNELAKQGLGLLLEKTPIAKNGSEAVAILGSLIEIASGKKPAPDFIDKPGPLIVQATRKARGGMEAIAVNGAMEIARNRFPALVKMLPKHPAILLASVVAALGAGIAIKNGIEKPYLDLVRNTETLKDAAAELEKVSQSMFQKQILFTRFLEEDARQETQFKATLGRVDEAGKDALDAIYKI